MDFQRCPSFPDPTAWLCLDALDRNIERVNHLAGNKQLRVATKSIRCVEVLKRIERRSPNFLGLMSYSAQETEFLLEQGFSDLLCAYPTVDLETVRACETRRDANGARVLWMVDRPAHLALLAKVGKALGRPVLVCIDLNLSMPLPGLYFGTRRSSISNLQALVDFVAPSPAWEHCRLAGVMGYEAQIAGVASGLQGFSPRTRVIRALQKRSARRVSQFRASAVRRLTQLHGPLELVNGGGSGSLAWSAAQPELSEVTAGSAYFMPAYFSLMPSMQDFEPAAGFALPVTRKPSPRVVTCHSGGFVASGAHGKDKIPQIIHPKGVDTFPLEGFGEVQTPLSLAPGVHLEIGDCVWLRHAKAGELCEHFNELVAFQDNQIAGRYLSYRGQGKSFH